MFMEFLTYIKIDILILQTIAMIITAILLPGFTVKGPISAFIAVACLSIINTHLWDTALFFSIPNSVTSHALTLVLANGILFWVLVKILPGIDTKGIVTPLIAPIVFTFFSVVLYDKAPYIHWRKLFSESVEYVSSFRDHLRKEEVSMTSKTQKHD